MTAQFFSQTFYLARFVGVDIKGESFNLHGFPGGLVYSTESVYRYRPPLKVDRSNAQSCADGLSTTSQNLLILPTIGSQLIEFDEQGRIIWRWRDHHRLFFE
jgi:hypothetical protein